MKTFSFFLLRLLFLVPVVCLGDTQFPIPPATISTAGINATSPYAAIDPNKHVVAVWLENGVVMSSSTTAAPSPTWSAPTVVSGSGAASPRVVIDANGNATAIWAENGVIKVATKPLAGSWSAPTILSGSGASSPYIGVDSSGDLVAVWVQNGSIMSSTHLFGGSWNVIPDTLSLSSNTSYPGLAVNASGAVVVVWQQQDATSTIYAIEKQVNGIWGIATPISLAPNSVYPRVAIDAAGNATAAWFQYQFSNNQYYNVILMAAQQTAGQTWGTAGAPVSVTSTASLRNPNDLVIAIAYGSIGSPIIAWTSSDDGATFNIEQAMFTAMSGWSVHPRLVEGNWGAFDVSVSVGPIGNNGTSWMRFDPVSGTSIVELAATTYGAFEDFTWTTYILSNGGNNAYPLTVTGGTSSAPGGVLIWENYNGTNTTIQAVASPVAVVQPPTGVSVTQQGTNFGVFTRYDNVLHWTPSVSPNLYGYIIERNNVIIAEIGPSNSYTDFNQDQNAPVTYTIFTMNNNGLQSLPVNVSFP